MTQNLVVCVTNVSVENVTTTENAMMMKEVIVLLQQTQRHVQKNATKSLKQIVLQSMR